MHTLCCKLLRLYDFLPLSLALALYYHNKRLQKKIFQKFNVMYWVIIDRLYYVNFK